jgi:hypothetical protein
VRNICNDLLKGGLTVMKKFMYGAMVVAGLVLTACGGAGSGSGAPGGVPNGGVSGVAHDNVLIGSTITVYQYSSGQAGAVLGSATTDQNGNYSISLQAETTSLLLVAKGGRYVEEASGKQITLSGSQMLRAVVPYTTGGNISTSITTYTNAAAGLADYRIKHGAGVAAAVASANLDISNMLGFDIVTTKPRDITNPANVTAYTSDEYSYGFLSAAISSWTMYASQQSGQSSSSLLHSSINSIAFADKMYQDINADGLLDGNGKDMNGVVVPLSLGTLPLSQNIYRYAIAAHVINISKNLQANKTALTDAQLVPFAQNYAGNTSMVWGSVPPSPFTDGLPVITITSLTPNQWVNGTYVPVMATFAKLGALISSTVSLDGVVIGSPGVAGNLFTFVMNSKLYADGGARTLRFDVLDTYGVPASQSITIGIDNTAPTMSMSLSWPVGYCGRNDGTPPDQFSLGCALTAVGQVVETGAGVDSITDLMTGAVIYPDVSGNWSEAFTGTSSGLSFKVRDKLGNCGF